MQRVERPQRVERQVQRIERQERRVERPARIERQQRIERPAKVERQAQRSERRETFRPRQRLDRPQQRGERRMEERIFAPRDDDRGTVEAARLEARDFRPVAPLFSARDMRPMKPFKAKFDNRRLVSIGERIEPSLAPTSIPTVYGSRYVDTPDYYYRYNNDLGYAYRIDRDDGMVRSLIPLFGGYGIGDPWPAAGQPMPAGYGTYNVPLDYRDRYADSDDQYYRYANGYVYQVDPGSGLIEEAFPVYA